MHIERTRKGTGAQSVRVQGLADIVVMPAEGDGRAYRSFGDCEEAIVEHGLARLVELVAALDGCVTVRLEVDKQNLWPLTHPQQRAEPHHAQQHDDRARDGAARARDGITHGQEEVPA